MSVLVLVLATSLALAIGLLIGMWGIVHELRLHVSAVEEERDKFRKEVQMAHDAIARASKVPISRPYNEEETKRLWPLEKSDSYWDGKTEITVSGQ